MRFTVHDSADYYQLKVSVFNDDKKTELIGETWVNLEHVVVPGGGKNDLWHNLNCKGRYAGEIRIELTYYDTRPKEEKAEERRQDGRQDASTQGSQDQGREAIGGPRQLKQVKRRPLPADPTEGLSSRPAMPDHSQSAPLPYTALPNNQQSYDSQPTYVDPRPDHRFESQSQFDNQNQYQTPPQFRGSPSGYDGFDQDHFSDGITNVSRMPGDPHSDQLDTYDTHSPSSYRQERASVQHGMYQREQDFERSPSYGQRSHIAEPTPNRDHQASDLAQYSGYNDRNDGPPAQPLPNGNGIPFSNSMPDVRPQPILQHSDSLQLRSSLPGSNNHDDLPAQNYLPPQGSHRWQNQAESLNDGPGPPPPPVHRHSGARSEIQPTGQGQVETYPPIAQPAPLRMRNERNSVSNSPLFQVQSNTSYTDHLLSNSPSNSNLSHSGASVTSRSSYSQHDRRQPQSNISSSPIRENAQSMPPSLVAGYAPSIVDDEIERDIRERRMSARPVYANDSVPQYRQLPNGYAPSGTHLPMNPALGPIRTIENAHDRRVHRSSAPVPMSKASISDLRTPIRKSVSPQPGSGPESNQRSAIPFSPDSYDAYNPSVSARSSINSAGPKYNTPEQAKDAFKQHEIDSRLAEGPIIGSDGREIDPSDHLPTETWAPEPEVKTPRKGPQITMRFRQSPLGAQPMPASSRRPLQDATGRPHSVSTPIFAHSADPNIAPTGRARLQKKTRSSMEQGTPPPNSSPSAPRMNNSPSPLAPRLDTNSYHSTPRASPSAYPIREPENYSYGSSPTYARSSPSGIPPPIPGKIPIPAGQEEWGRDALSEEMRRIDIGVGGGQSRVRRSRFGA